MVTTIIGIAVGSFLLCLIVALLAVMRERRTQDWPSKPYKY